MTAKELLATIHPNSWEKTKEFLGKRTPHPDEIQKPEEKIRVSAAKNYPHDFIELHQITTALGTDVQSKTCAIGIILVKKDEEIPSFLGEWDTGELRSAAKEHKPKRKGRAAEPAGPV